MPPPRPPAKWWTWTKMLVIGGAICIGGPALTYYVSPTDEELFKKYNPDLQKKSLQGRYERQKAFDDYVTQLKEFSKSDKPIWVVREEAERKFKEERLREDRRNEDEKKKRTEELRREAGLETR